jgi:hypothetical protein
MIDIKFTIQTKTQLPKPLTTKTQDYTLKEARVRNLTGNRIRADIEANLELSFVQKRTALLNINYKQ